MDLTDARPLWNGILSVLRTGAQWSELARKYPPYQTCHRWFQSWVKDGTFRKVLRELASDLKERGGFDLEDGFADASFLGTKKGGPASERRSAGRRPRSWQLSTALVFLSLLASQALRPTRSKSSRPRSTKDSLMNSQSGPSEAMPTTATNSMSGSGTSAA
ncbi:transposase [Myxococcus sp. AM009]|uniref:transposase n=1 Tax=Myxococcus sp. AM009 TaxID=2745137 RepID=UPI0015962083|nr:transposase [Myxococcus sp. AM009]